MIGNYLSLVKFSHTIFAMPFALTGFFLGWSQMSGEVSWAILGYVILCMVFARNAAMAFNRWADRQFDAQNARTRVREIPAGVIPAKHALLFTLINCGLFMGTTFFINWACFALSPVALAVVLGYSYTKRFTALCHLVLGLGLGLAPVGAFLAVTGFFALPPILLGLAVLTWVSGFDVIYALQDDDFDKSQGLHSIPAALGRKNALWVSTLLHFASATAIILFSFLIDTNWLGWVGTALFLCLLTYQHLIVSPTDLKRVNLAFFTTNGIAAVLFAIWMITGILLKI